MIPPYSGPAVQNQVNIELGNYPEYQLYNLAKDLSQERNLAESNPEKLQEMIKRFEQIRGIESTNVEELELK